MKKYTTIKDIARELGCSISTVSRALTNSAEVSAETRELVLRKAEEMNYHPNILARNLSSRRSGVVGVIVPEFETDFFPRVILGIQDELSRSGYRILITQSGESAIKERENLELLLGNMVEGIMASVTQEGGNEEAFQKAIKSGIPVVFFNRVYNLPRASKVIIDDRKLAYESVKHLLDQGYDAIYHLAGPKNMNVAKQRIEGYQDALDEYGMQANIIEVNGVSITDGYSTMRELLNGGVCPQAVFCFNDNIAVGAIKAAKESGKRIPEDIAFVGFSETEISTIIEPHLTTTAQPRYQMGVEAAKVMMEQITTKGRSMPTNMTLSAKLNVRDSSKKK